MLGRKTKGPADLWHVDDGDIICRPVLGLSYLQAFDTACVQMWADRTPQKTEDYFFAKPGCSPARVESQ